MGDKHYSSHFPIVVDLSVVALVAVLAAMLYLFGIQLSGQPTSLTNSVRDAAIFDTRGTPG